MKSLLDILQKEKELTKLIDKLTLWADSESAQIKKLGSLSISAEEREEHIKMCIDTRDRLYERRAESIQELDEIRNELSLYFKRLFDR